MKQTLTIIALFICLGIMVGCTNTTPPSDTSDTDNWQTYQNDEWGISFKYPEGWYYQDEDADDSLFLMFEDHPFEIVPESDFVATITLSIKRKNIDEVIKGFINSPLQIDEEITDGSIDGLKITKLKYFSDMLSDHILVYFVEHNNMTLTYSIPDDQQYISIIENMIKTLQ